MTQATALIVGSRDDPHVSAVLHALSGRRTTPVVVDAETLRTGRSHVTADRVIIEGVEGATAVMAASRGWLRRSSPPSWERGVMLGSEDAAIQASWLALLNAIGAVAHVSWLTDPAVAALAENKMRQYATASRIGIRTPRTIVASDRDAVIDYLGGEFVVKPLGPAQFDTPEGTRVLLSETVTGSSVDPSTWAAAPVIAQEKLVARRHLRVVTVAQRAWVGALDVAPDLPLDWRRDPRAHEGFRTAEDGDAIGALGLQLCHEMGVGFSSQDWLVSQDGRAYFLDLNPGGQWLFLPFASDIAEAVATWLGGGDR